MQREQQGFLWEKSGVRETGSLSDYRNARVFLCRRSSGLLTELVFRNEIPGKGGGFRERGVIIAAIRSRGRFFRVGDWRRDPRQRGLLGLDFTSRAFTWIGGS